MRTPNKWKLRTKLSEAPFRFIVFSFLFLFWIFYLFFKPNVIDVVVTQAIIYTSTFDNFKLVMDIAYDKNKTKEPIILVLHGYSGLFDEENEIIKRFAVKGMFAVKTHKRGFGGSEGISDDSGREIYDLFDAVEYAKKNYSKYVDATNINVVGYSGGGGNVYGLITKFPDYFRTAQLFWGMSDYGHDDIYGWWNNGGLNYRADMEKRIGGVPVQKKGNYYARAHYLGAKNNPYTHIQLFYDEEETLVPPTHAFQYLRIAEAAGLTNIVLRLSKAKDAYRYLHALPLKADVKGAGNIKAEENFIPDILAGTYNQPNLKVSDTMFIPGYLRTNKFQIILGNGNDQAGNLTYDLSNDGALFTIESLTGTSSISLTVYGLMPNADYAIADENVNTNKKMEIRSVTDSSGALNFKSILVGIHEYQIFPD